MECKVDLEERIMDDVSQNGNDRVINCEPTSRDS